MNGNALRGCGHWPGYGLGSFRRRPLVWIADDAVQLRNDVIAAAKKAGPSSHGKCAAPGWTVSVAFGNSRAAPAAVSGVGLASRSPAYTSTGAASRPTASRVAAGLNAPSAPKPPRTGNSSDLMAQDSEMGRHAVGRRRRALD